MTVHLPSLGHQVLFCYKQFDELTLLHLREFDKKKLISVETDIAVDHYKEEKFEESHSGRCLTGSFLINGAFLGQKQLPYALVKKIHSYAVSKPVILRGVCRE